MPMTVKTILCPVNIRHVVESTNAFDEALEMAKRHKAKLIVASVAPEFERNLNILDPAEYWGKELDKFISRNSSGDVEVERVVKKGAVHREIVRLAAAKSVDVIVMEAANPKVQDYLLGTTASHVVAHARCSVYVVRS
ncbi:universal stress protein [Histidinibacterium aquaticum]|uniref:Universal stress protein n=1 Tax=Histidinibacterium aquaticum TaxID=2613962 RepID=A0A5J5GJE5_9RHOB|nr:universal stress protein [Histidinibacterium aquaticum]KAA9008237.1 universal stress protein [Histidinibacterium aquaticum]